MKLLNNQKAAVFYNVSISILAVVSVIIAIRSFFVNQGVVESAVDSIIWLIFIADYVVRFVLAKNKRRFFLTNIIDLIAILPFYSIFQFFRIGRIARALRLIKLVRISSRAWRFAHFSKRFLNTNGFKFVLVAVCCMVFVSAFLMMIIENMTFLDALWWSFVTVTTVGYGDLSPASHAGRILAVILMLFGIGLIGSLTSTITAFFIGEKKESQNEFVAAAISKLECFNDLSENDIIEISNVLLALKKGELK